MIPAPLYPGHLPVMPSCVPPGAVMAFAGKITEQYAQPADFESMVNTYGWMLCDGRTLSQQEYPILYHVLGKQYNTGDEKDDEFSVPDYRGYFFRMTDMGSARDPDAGSRKLANGNTSSEVGSIQEDALQSHQHIYKEPGKPPVPIGSSGTGSPITAGDSLTGNPTDSMAPPGNVRTSTETRAKNVYVYYIIKFL
ncbi:Phage Tail Collar Domain [Chitinophaga eiseniae]|uniref:Phage Tail Collar Domain n=1 Tax=Chitinophaga eiseniae TaxID=634771 RepID=A0A1T4TQJ6_9BACT|nr:phage tail protein [Chitinophaga eiseniae]SKA42730.1 Phage Tail Collar Domain [Chitinophaga eiseniae]